MAILDSLCAQFNLQCFLLPQSNSNCPRELCPDLLEKADRISEISASVLAALEQVHAPREAQCGCL